MDILVFISTSSLPVVGLGCFYTYAENMYGGRLSKINETVNIIMNHSFLGMLPSGGMKL